jgi:methyl-accepting chemotaxis protein
MFLYNGVRMRKFNLKISTKINLVIGLLIFIVAVVAVFGVKVMLSSQVEKKVEQTAKEVAIMSQNTLNMFMLTGLISEKANRQMFFDKTAASKNMKEFRVIRGDEVNKVYGEGLSSELPKDTIDNQMLSSGKTIMQRFEEGNKQYVRVSYPFEASKDFRGTDCTSCHAVKEGTVLGGASVVIDITDDIDAINKSVVLLLITSLLGFAFVFFLVHFAMTKLVSNPLTHFQNGLLEFFNFLNRKTDKVELIDLKTGDEFEIMAEVINENIKLAEQRINIDNLVIDEANVVLKKVSSGFYNQEIKATANSESIGQLVLSINQMIRVVKGHFVELNAAFLEYTQYDYKSKITLKNIESGSEFDKLQNNGNQLRDAIVEMLKTGKTNGGTLSGYADKLLENVNELNVGSMKTADLLAETTDLLGVLTLQSKESVDKVTNMYDLSSQVSRATKAGGDKATETRVSMDEINNNVQSINDAIRIVEQIAFQTNILSLNAAVEAATAGEHGKGFAVVATEVRNLAAKSADAANEIKTLVVKAMEVANRGRGVSDEMIMDFEKLNEHIAHTIELIKEVTENTKQQQLQIQQINVSIREMDEQTSNNAVIASSTNEVALETSEIAQEIMSDVSKKHF